MCFTDKNKYPCLLFLLIFFQSVAVHATADFSLQHKKYEHQRQSGIDAFHRGEYKQAKQFLQSALQILEKDKTGIGQKAYTIIYYNLGSVYYKLKQYNTSRFYFRKLLGNKKLAAIAYYNLALIENRQGDKAQALHYLKQSKRQTTDSRFAALVERQIAKLTARTSSYKVNRKRVKKRAANRKDWHAYLYLSPGYDSNIKFSPLDIASNESGRFLQLTGLFDKRLTAKNGGRKKPALLVTGTAFLLNYFSTNFNDFGLVDVGLRYLYPINQWFNRFDINFRQSSYGHSDYQRSYVATVQTSRYFPGNNILRLRYRYEQINSINTRFDYLEGNRQKLTAKYFLRWPADTLLLWYEFEWNNRNNLPRVNYSPTRNTLRLRYAKHINHNNKISAEIAYRRSDYDSTTLLDRLDKRSTYALAYVYDFAPGWQFALNWRWQKNRSTESIYAYDRQLGLLSLRKSF